MPKRNRNQKRTRSRTMRGGVDFGSWWTSVTEGASAAAKRVQDTATGAYASVAGPQISPTPVPTNQYNQPAVPVYPDKYNQPAAPLTSAAPVSTSVMNDNSYGSNMGGRRRSRKMHGGYTPNTPTTGLAFYASPISDIKTAQAHNWVGGKTKRHRKHKKHSKSHKRRSSKSHKRMHHRK
jgi:hypothetical protein